MNTLSNMNSTEFSTALNQTKEQIQNLLDQLNGVSPYDESAQELRQITVGYLDYLHLFFESTVELRKEHDPD